MIAAEQDRHGVGSRRLIGCRFNGAGEGPDDRQMFCPGRVRQVLGRGGAKITAVLYPIAQFAHGGCNACDPVGCRAHGTATAARPFFQRDSDQRDRLLLLAHVKPRPSSKAMIEQSSVIKKMELRHKAL